MKSENVCDYERKVVKELKNKQLSEETKIHLSKCEDCRETLKISGWMRSFAASELQPAPSLPAPGLIWWKAQLFEKQSKARRATLAVVWMQILAVIIVVLSVFALAVKNQERFATIWTNISESFQLIAVPLLLTFAVGATIYLAIAFKGFFSAGSD